MNLTDATQVDYAGPCPRCGQPVPSRENQGKYPGALSRLDNKTHICSVCGQDEAIYQATVSPDLPPITQRVLLPGQPEVAR